MYILRKIIGSYWYYLFINMADRNELITEIKSERNFERDKLRFEFVE